MLHHLLDIICIYANTHIYLDGIVENNMSLKIKFKGNIAITRWNNPMEKEFYKMKMVELRDSDPKTHPVMSVKDEGGEEIMRPHPTVKIVPQSKPAEAPPASEVKSSSPEMPVESPATVVRYYTKEQLKQEGKITCDECIYHGQNEECKLTPTMMITPDNSYLSINGTYLGCIHGSRKNERIQ